MKTSLDSSNHSAAHKLESAIFAALLIYQALIIFSVATDINGDPNDYLNLARNFFSGEVFSNFNRFIGYPLFIKITSLNLLQLNLTFIAQLIIFLSSLRYFAFSLSKNPLTRIFIYSPAFLPAIAYLPKLLFPDCLLLSLTLLLCASLLRRDLIISGVLVFALTLVKLVFVFAVFFWAALFLARCFPKRARLVSALYLCALILLVPAVFLAAPFPLYQTTVQNPIFVLDHERSNPFPVKSSAAIKCGNEIHLLNGVVSEAAITEHSSDALNMPIGITLASKWGCTLQDIKIFQRQLILESVLSDPGFHGYKFLNRFLRDLFVFPDAQHVWWMLDTKLHLQVTYGGEDVFYSPTELDYFKSQGMPPLKQPNVRLLASMVKLNPFIEKALSYTVIVGVIMVLAFWYKSRTVSKDVILILGFLTSYNFVLCFFAFGYDRYLLVNYFLWFGALGLCFNPISKYFHHQS